MPELDAVSIARRSTLHPLLRNFVDLAIKYVDFRITVGHRGQKEQTEKFALGRSKEQWPNSKHNSDPSLAFDFAPKPGLYDRHIKDFYYVAGVMKGLALAKGFDIRCGADWDGDFETQDQTLHDPGHVELVLPAVPV